MMVMDQTQLKYSYFIDLPSGAQVPGVRFKIVQQRNTAAGTNDNGGNTDHYGIIDFIQNLSLLIKLSSNHLQVN